MLKTLALRAALATCFYAGCVGAQSLEYPERDGRFLERGSEGWFWYEPLQEPEEKPEVVAEPPPPPSPVETVTIPEVTPPPTSTPAAPAPPSTLSAEWIRKNMQKYQDAAWDNPTPENIAAFLYLQSYTIDKSRKMADASAEVIAVNPILDVSTSRPSTQGSYSALDKQAVRNTRRLLSKLSSEIGIWFFYNKGPLSQQQAMTLSFVRDSLDFTILPISLDGSPVPGGHLTDHVQDQGQSSMLDILSVPALLVVHPSGKFASLGQGGLSKPEIESRLLIIARQNGWITEDEYNSTKGDLTPVGEIARTIEDRLGPNETASGDTEPDGFIPPTDLIQELNKNILTIPRASRD